MSNMANIPTNLHKEYIPTNWQNGDIITAEKLNKIEDGIASSFFYLPTSQLQSALINGTDVLLIIFGEDGDNDFESAYYVDNMPTSPALAVMVASIGDGEVNCDVYQDGTWIQTKAFPTEELANIHSTVSVVMESVWCYSPDKDTLFIPTGTAIAQGTKQGGGQ